MHPSILPFFALFSEWHPLYRTIVYCFISPHYNDYCAVQQDGETILKTIAYKIKIG